MHLSQIEYAAFARQHDGQVSAVGPPAIKRKRLYRHDPVVHVA